MDRTLLLNASFEPLHIITWQRAITLLFLGKVEVVDEYEREVRSVSIALRVPAVVRLLRYVSFRRVKPPLTRINLLARDEFRCQYCRCDLSVRELTLDHIVPRSQGGETTWQNVVAACHHCNRKKGGRTPREARMKLAKQPYEPDWLPVINIKLSRRLPAAWLLFLDST